MGLRGLDSDADSRVGRFLPSSRRRRGWSPGRGRLDGWRRTRGRRLDGWRSVHGRRLSRRVHGRWLPGSVDGRLGVGLAGSFDGIRRIVGGEELAWTEHVAGSFVQSEPRREPDAHLRRQRSEDNGVAQRLIAIEFAFDRRQPRPLGPLQPAPVGGVVLAQLVKLRAVCVPRPRPVNPGGAPDARSGRSLHARSLRRPRSAQSADRQLEHAVRAPRHPARRRVKPDSVKPGSVKPRSIEPRHHGEPGVSAVARRRGRPAGAAGLGFGVGSHGPTDSAVLLARARRGRAPRGCRAAWQRGGVGRCCETRQ
jgi:hypothetical protein